MAHAANSPSSLFRRIPCPGSKNAEAGRPDTSGEAAIDGTGSHYLLEDCITMELPTSAFVGATVGEGDEDKPEGWIVEQARADRVQVLLDYIERRVAQLRREHDIVFAVVDSEIASNPGSFFDRADWNGTADISIRWEARDGQGGFYGGLEVIDLKDGRAYVSEQNNPQFISYAGGLMRKSQRLKSFEVRLTVAQPKTRTPIRFQTFTGYDLWYELVKINDALALTDPADAPRIAGDHCHWCKNKPNCVEYAAQSQQGLIRMNDITANFGKTMDQLTGPEIAHILDTQPKIMARFKEITEEAIKRSDEDENAIPGYGMVPGKGQRGWAVSDDDMVKKLKAMKISIDEYYEDKKLKSPAQMEKIQKFVDAPKKMKNLEKLIVTTVGTPKFGIKLNNEKTVEEVFKLAPGESIFEPPTLPAAPSVAAPKPPSFL